MYERKSSLPILDSNANNREHYHFYRSYYSQKGTHTVNVHKIELSQYMKMHAHNALTNTLRLDLISRLISIFSNIYIVLVSNIIQ